MCRTFAFDNFGIRCKQDLLFCILSICGCIRIVVLCIVVLIGGMRSSILVVLSDVLSSLSSKILKWNDMSESSRYGEQVLKIYKSPLS